MPPALSPVIPGNHSQERHDPALILPFKATNKRRSANTLYTANVNTNELHLYCYAGTILRSLRLPPRLHTFATLLDLYGPDFANTSMPRRNERTAGVHNVEADALVGKVFDAFAGDASVLPPMTLRGGCAIDEYREPPPFDPAVDDHSDSYLERYAWGIGYLDAASWRHYLPILIRYALRHVERDGQVIRLLIVSLRPPEREPPRLATLEAAQKAVITQFLSALAFGKALPHQELACEALEEWCAPGPLYRPSARDG